MQPILLPIYITKYTCKTVRYEYVSQILKFHQPDKEQIQSLHAILNYLYTLYASLTLLASVGAHPDANHLTDTKNSPHENG